MLFEAILDIENSNLGKIHLVRDRLFYQAWELSAYLFVQHFRPYKVHHKCYQKVGKDLVWLGFPKSVLGDLEQESIKEGFQFDRIHEDHIVIQSIPFIEGFEDWKQGQLFANVYLNKLDHFIKRDQGIRCFLKERLHLILHPRKYGCPNSVLWRKV